MYEKFAALLKERGLTAYRVAKEKDIAPFLHKLTNDSLKCFGKFFIQLINSFIINHILLKMYQH